jgi:hypothetical protein
VWTGQADRRGQEFRLADEVRYIQRRATDHHGRFVTIGQLVLFSTETGDAWLLDPADRLAARLEARAELYWLLSHVDDVTFRLGSASIG